MVNFVPVSILEEQPTYNNKSYVNNLLFKKPNNGYGGFYFYKSGKRIIIDLVCLDRSDLYLLTLLNKPDNQFSKTLPTNLLNITKSIRDTFKQIQLFNKSIDKVETVDLLDTTRSPILAEFWKDNPNNYEHLTELKKIASEDPTTLKTGSDSYLPQNFLLRFYFKADDKDLKSELLEVNLTFKCIEIMHIFETFDYESLSQYLNP